MNSMPATPMSFAARKDCQAGMSGCSKRGTIWNLSPGATAGQASTWLLDLAGIGRAKLEALGRVDPDGVEQLAADELDARDERLRRLDVVLDEHDAVDGVLKGFAREMLLERGLRVDQLDAKSLAGAVVLEDDRIADGRGSLRECARGRSRRWWPASRCRTSPALSYCATLEISS